MLDSNASAIIDLSRRTPDFFSCKNCAGYGGSQFEQPAHRFALPHGWVYKCTVLREEGACRAMMLAAALASGAVQIVLHLGQPALLEGGR